MAKRFDDNLMTAARDEYKRTKNGTPSPAAPTPAPEPEKKDPEVKNAAPDPSPETQAQSHGSESFASEPVRDEFAEKFNEYFGTLGKFATGSMIVELIDDYKANAFLIYAKKHKIEGIEKEMLLMQGKPKEFAAFLVDHALKNNLVEWVKKFPLIGAVLVMALSAGGTFMMLKSLKGKNDEMEEMKKELQKFREAAAKTTEPDPEIVIPIP